MTKTLTITLHSGEIRTFKDVTKTVNAGDVLHIHLLDKTLIEISRGAIQTIVTVPDPTEGLTFDRALVAMKAGHKVGRAGWNGKGMWICLGSGATQVAEKLWNKHTRDFAYSHGGYVDVLPYFIMKTADDKILMGWLASQSDLVATDWEILP